MRFLILLAVCLLTFTPPSQAAPPACNAAAEGTIVYNKDHKIVQFCDGTQWIGMVARIGDTGDTLADLSPSCTNDQIAKWNGTAWACAADATGAAASSVWLNDGPGGPGEIYYNGGNVGIGTATPDTSLSVRGGGINIGGTFPSDIWSESSMLAVGNSGAGGQSQGLIGHQGSHELDLFWNFYRKADSSYGSIGANGFASGNGIRLGNSGIQFVGADTIGATIPPTNVAILNNGNVGIGTSSPANKLHVLGQSRLDSSSHQLLLADTETSAVEWSLTTQSDQDFGIWEDAGSGSSRFTIKAGGNVGIGTMSPIQNLDVNGAIATKSYVFLRDANGGDSKTAGLLAWDDALYFRRHTAGTDAYETNVANLNLITGTFSATKFVGDGSGLTNLPAGADNLGAGGTTTGTLYALNGSGYGYLGSSGDNYFRFDDAPAASAGRIYTRLGANWEYLFHGDYFAPFTTNVNDLGSSTLRWKDGWFQGTVTGGTFSGSGASLTALNAANLASGTVPAARMPALTGDVTMTVGTTVTAIAANAVTTAEILDSTITSADIAADTIAAADIAAGAVGTSEIADGSITAADTAIVGTLTEGKWCTVSSGKIVCTSDAPTGGGTPCNAVNKTWSNCSGVLSAAPHGTTNFASDADTTCGQYSGQASYSCSNGTWTIGSSSCVYTSDCSSGGSCFGAGSKVLLASGGTKAIEALEIGDKVVGRGGKVNTVIALKPTTLGDRKLYTINGRLKVTADHPALTDKGWGVISRNLYAERYHNRTMQVILASGRAGEWNTSMLPPERMQQFGLGNKIAFGDDGFQEITRLTSEDLPGDTPLYTVALDGDGTMQLEGGFVFIGLAGAPVPESRNHDDRTIRHD